MPAEVAGDWQQTAGPRLFEQVNYSVMARAKSDAVIKLLHRDPLLIVALGSDNTRQAIFGRVNFKSQVGMSEFSVLVDDTPEFDFQVEIFPSKIDYQSDYEQLTADAQEILTGLVLEYLRATFQMGAPSVVPKSSQLEWAILLKHVMDDLERAFDYIAQHPHRSLRREPEDVPAHRIRRVDASVRRAVARGSGAGQKRQISDDLAVRERILERTAQSTLDTPEHRWLAHQLRWVQRRLAQISIQLSQLASKNARLAKIQSEIKELEQRAARLSQVPPLRAAQNAPPANFASLKLLAAPGYGEAYRSLLLLSLGLRLMGGPVGASIKEIAVLYEYWCYLTVVRLCSRMLGRPVPVQQLIKAEQNGLMVRLQRGQETMVPFDLGSGRLIQVRYNPQFQGEDLLVAQKPDILLTFLDSAWPKYHIILDAKYRIDGSAEIRKSYGAPTPPPDAINVLYRYRDAIVEIESSSATAKPQRTVVEAVALYPYREEQPATFASTRMWSSLKRVGIGAIPFLPEGTEYFEDYLRTLLERGGWALADRAIAHRLSEHAVNWRIAASKSVLIGVLRDKIEEQHFAWIEQKHMYYIPMRREQGRQYDVKSLAIYSPVALREHGAVTHKAEVRDIRVQERQEIETPWGSAQAGDQLQVVYYLGPLLPLDKPIENKPEEKRKRAARFSAPRWSSELALQRAQTVAELVLETEPEWRMYEELQARRIKFWIQAGRAELQRVEDPRGRAWFRTESARIQYRGAAGFVLRRGTTEQFIGSPIDVADALLRERDERGNNGGGPSS